MMDLIYNVHYALYFRLYQWWKKKNSKAAEFLFRVNLKLFTSFLTGAYTKYLEKEKTACSLNQSSRAEKIVASLTTFPARIGKVHLTIATIMNQQVKPDMIELWLAREQFPEGLEGLPPQLLALQSRGVDIRFCEDLRSHKKYHYAMREHPQDVVITFDDDVFYPTDTIQTLTELQKMCPDQVVGMSCATFRPDNMSVPIHWEQQVDLSKDSSCLCVVGCAGTLFPPGSLHENAFDIPSMKQLCPLADDLWLTAMTYMNGKTISTAGRCPFPISLPDTQEISLTHTNNTATAEINNNTQWNAILEHYERELATWRASVQ